MIKPNGAAFCPGKDVLLPLPEPPGGPPISDMLAAQPMRPTALAPHSEAFSADQGQLQSGSCAANAAKQLVSAGAGGAGDLSTRPAASRGSVSPPPRSQQAWHVQSEGDDGDSCDVIPCLTADKDVPQLSEPAPAGSGFDSSQDNASIGLTVEEDNHLPSEPAESNGGGNGTDNVAGCTVAEEDTTAAADRATPQPLTAALSAGFAGAAAAHIAGAFGLF